MSEKETFLEITKKKGNAYIIYKNKIESEIIEKPEINIPELKKELIDIKKNQLSMSVRLSEEISESQKQKKMEQIIKKWLNLQKTIKEEITLEDVIIKQQENDENNLKSFFKKFYEIKLKTRRNLEDIKKLKLEKNNNGNTLFIIEEEMEKNFKDACEPTKNLLFLLRNNYDYLIRIISQINQEDFVKNSDKINSLVELFNNQFYENILLPNPEQQELLILIYKLLEEELMPMGGASPDDFLNNNSFSGIFLSSYAKRQEIIGYISMILNPLILSIDNDPKECLDLSIISIKKFLDKLEKERKTSLSNTKSADLRLDFDRPNFIKKYLNEKIPKTKIKFKNNFELEAEKEKEDEIKYISKDDDDLNELNDLDNNLVYIHKPRRTVIQKHTLFLNNKESEYNNEYKYDLTKNRLIEKINKENDPELKQFYIKHLEDLNFYPNKYTNEGIIKLIEIESEKKESLLELYKANFLYIREFIEELLQTFIDKIITFPYPLRCICKIIYLLISKKYPFLSKYEINSYIGKFLLDKCIFPVLSLENKNFIDSRVFSTKTKNCIDIIINVLYKTNNCSLFDTYSDPEKTIFNQFIIELLPILNKFYEKIIDVQLPKIIEELINKTSKQFEQTLNKKIFNFRHKKKKNTQTTPVETPKGPDNTVMPPPLFQYFEENSDEILHLQSVCFTVEDILFLIDLIGRNIQIFSDLPKYNFFNKTYKRIKNEFERLNGLLEEETKSNKKQFYVIFKDEINEQLKKLIQNKKKDRSTFESSEQDSDLICKRIKFCIKTILKGLNLLNNKDFAYLNFAQSSDKFFSALKYTLEELGEYSELSNKIPLKWYSQYIFNYKKELGNEYQKDDFSKLYEEIYTEEANILNELKSLSSIVITRDGMNLRCAEKIIEKYEYELRRIEEAKKYEQVEKFINTRRVEVCITPYDDYHKNSPSEDILPVTITDIKSCQHNSQNETNIYHAYSINDFINKFSDNKENKGKIRLRNLVKEDINKGDRGNKTYAIIGKYMEYVKKQIKEPENKNIFGDIKEKESQEFLEKIENHIVRHIYKYVFPQTKSRQDLEFLKLTRSLDWILPEHLEIKKLYVNQLKFAEKYIKKINEEKSVFDKLECIHNAYVTMNNTVKFISGKNEDAGQDELTPLFQYVLIKSQPEKLFTNIYYIKAILSEADLIGPKGFYVSQMESASDFISQIDHNTLRISEEEFNKNKEDSNFRYHSDSISKIENSNQNVLRKNVTKT